VRIVLYTHHALFEPALSLAESLAESAEVHLLLEVPAGSWQLANFEAESTSVATGLVDADPVGAVLSPQRPGKVAQDLELQARGPGQAPFPAPGVTPPDVRSPPLDQGPETGCPAH
jgi:hypothetical protein